MSGHSRALRLQPVAFGGGPRHWDEPPALVDISQPLPKHTMDPRYRRCVSHHLACDCREAEMAEQIHELTVELREWRELAEHLIDLVPPERLVRELRRSMWDADWQRQRRDAAEAELAALRARRAR